MAPNFPSWVTLAFSALTSLLIYFFIKFYNHRRFHRNVPAPPHSFLWGHLKLVGDTMARFPPDTHWQIIYTAIAQKYDLPGAWYLDLWPAGPPHLIVTDPDLAHQFTVLKNLPKHPVGNLAGANGAAWKAAHNMVAPAFSTSHQRNMAGMMAEEVMVFRSTLQKKAATGEVFKIEQVLHNLVLNTIARSIFEESLDAQMKEIPMLATFYEVCDLNIILIRSFNPIAKLFARRKQNELNRKLETQLGDMIRVRFEKVQRDDIDISQKRGLCIMDLILREHLLEVQKAQRAPLDPKFMYMAATQVRTILLAGSGTTTGTLSFAYALLSLHPEVLQKLRLEHDNVFCPGTEETYALLQQDLNRLNGLEYTTNVIKEVLRLYPIGNSARGSDGAEFITYQGRQLPIKGHVVTGMQHAMHYDNKIFPHASKFDPDRFSRDEIPRNAWRPFERGPRACIGQTMAMEEMKVTLLLTVRDFDFECSGLQPTKQRVGWTDLDTVLGDRAFQRWKFEAGPRDGMPMTVKPPNRSG
ncbi:cytochrome P450 [Bimuria novae-zelandiae CBS 107.79]|uniref:Cytochrome P450 n=1 Tax=Bimuria novae-zelandiae CBS 107.79 TaxID=1447943 RepID=A0A6A5VEV0_9PLEO|nr:cytochrome P450 [Bimuria novae-zelandiae CBS 107.79]